MVSFAACASTPAKDASVGGSPAAGASGSSGSISGGASAGGVPGSPPSPLTRPQLSSSEEASYDVLDYFAKAGDVLAPTTDNWDPTAFVGDPGTFSPSFRVMSSGGTHTTVQSAIDAAVLAGGTERIYIQVAPGTYRETVCVPTGAPPMTLYSDDPDASLTEIVYDNYSGRPKPAGSPANACNENVSATTYGTSGSATFAVNASEFAAHNITFSNDTDEAAASSNVQGVALMTQGDRVVFHNVRVLGNQDTLLVKTPNVSTITRAYFKDSYIEGDVDFIFGRGTLVLESCTIHVLTSRTPSGVVAAPSTDSRNPYGFLVIGSTLSAEPGTADGTIHLGRAWDEGQGDLANYAIHVASGIYPNGQAVFRECTLGAHIQRQSPWRAAATTTRPYSSTSGTYPANRFFEARNTGPGSLTDTGTTP